MTTRQQYIEAYRLARIERPLRRWVNPYQEHPLMSAELSEKYRALYEKRDRQVYDSDHTLDEFRAMLRAGDWSLRSSYLAGTGAGIPMRFGWKGE